jgi:O-antigen/teichoic acid export membrane protein
LKTAERVIMNTAVLYARLIIVMAIGLFTTRIVFDALGETNYGIYTLVAGVVGMLAILQSTMSSTSMRYMAHSLGSGDEYLNSRTFNTTLFLHFIIGVSIMVIIETGGFFMFRYFLEIPADKIVDAKIVFHLMVVTTFIAIISVPYDAVINSHENLLVLSIVDIIGAVLKLAVAFYLTITDLNLLIIYGFGMFLVQLIMRIIKQQYSMRHYMECSFDFKKGFDKNLIKEIMAYSGWELFASISSISLTQVRSVLLNMFFGVKVNASEGIAKTASGQVNTVSVSLTNAIKPQLFKSEGSGDRQKMLRITNLSTKFSVFLFALISIPVIIELPFLLNIWLKEVPEYAVVFTRLTLIGLLISKFSFDIATAIRAAGKIKWFTLIESIIIVMNIPVAYVFFKLKYPPETIYMVTILISIIIFFVRLFLGHKIIQLDVNNFIKEAIFPILIPIIVSFLISFLLFFLMNDGFLRSVFVFLISISTLILLFVSFGVTKNEKNRLISMFYTILEKFKIHK